RDWSSDVCSSDLNIKSYICSMETKDIKDFVAGKYVQRMEYRSFSPEKINLHWALSDSKLLMMLGEADRELGKLEAFSSLLPDFEFFIRMHITKEATVSSKIEGTQTSFEEALVMESAIDPERRDDWKEVNNYIRAVNEAIEMMYQLPLSGRLIKNTHKLLLDGVRGKNKLPAEYRSSQNWIVRSLKNAVFVPQVHEEIPELMQDLEYYIHSDLIGHQLQVPH